MSSINSKSIDPSGSRLYSLDALRGFDMFWIAGGAAFIRTLARGNSSEWLNTLSLQMQHVKWEGFHFYDLIFPLFMFISGVAIPYSLLSKLETGFSKRQIIKKTARRMILLIILGIIYNGNLRDGFSNPLLESVLGQIGVAYFFASLIIIYFPSIKSRLYWLAGILVSYAAIQLLVPVPGIGAGVLTPEGCINGYIDRMLLPGRLYGGTFDPQGWLCMVSATGITLMGSVAGHFLRQKETRDIKKLKILGFFGIISILLGLIISPFYPPIKSCWTTTFNLLAGGISFLLIALFYLIIDVWGKRKWAFFFKVIGMNSIFIYLFTSLVNVGYTSRYLFGWIAAPSGEKGGQLVLIAGGICLTWLLLYYMYKKKIFFKV